MAEHINNTADRLPKTAAGTGRRSVLVAGACAAMGAAAARGTDLFALNPDAELLALRARFEASARDVGRAERQNTPDDLATKVFEEFESVCWAIVFDAPAAQTAEGLSFKASAAMHRLRETYCRGGWPGEGEALAWEVLSHIAGAAYVPIEVPESIRHLVEPERRCQQYEGAPPVTGA